MSFSVTAFPSSSSSSGASGSANATQTSPATSQTSDDSSTTSNAAAAVMMGRVGDVKIGGGLVGMAVALTGATIGGAMVL